MAGEPQRDDLLMRLRLVMADHPAPTLAGEFPDAAVAVAITRDADNPELLLTQRAAHLRLHPLEIAFPGGKYDVEDGDLLTTAKREMHEEVGIAPAAFESLGRLRQRVTRSHIRVTPFVGLIPQGIEPDINPGEIESAFRLPLAQLMEPRHFSVEQVQYRGRQRQVAHFHLAGRDIWGVTAMIIADLLNSVFHANLPIDVSKR